MAKSAGDLSIFMKIYNAVDVTIYDNFGDYLGCIFIVIDKTMFHAIQCVVLLVQ